MSAVGKWRAEAERGKPKPYRSGFCNPSNPMPHPRCPASYKGRACCCDCHQPVRTLVTEQAELVDVRYLSDEWYTVRRDSIAASEVAATLGLSPWMSPFDLFWLKRTGEPSQDENKGMRRGRRYEALILEDFADEHPEFHVAPSVTARNIERPWQVSTPDGLAYECGCKPDPDPDVVNACLCGIDREPVAVVEAKTGQRREWGEPGTDDIPVHYRCQVLWQMDTLGLNVAYLPVLFGDQYAEYVVEYDEADVKILREAAAAFLVDVREDRMPDVDAHTATARRLKKLHASVEPGEVEVSPSVVAQYHAAKRLRDASEARMRLAENRIRAALGPHNIATVDGRRVASRSVVDIKERTQTVRAHTRNTMRWSKPR